MKISGFTFIRNGEKLGYPFIASIKSILPIVDEFIIALGRGEDNTEEMIKALNEPKIRIINTVWNENMKVKGYVYGQQKMIAQFACTGDWAFYLEADEVIHEDDYGKIIEAMKKYKDNDRVEALAFDYYHFYGNMNTFMDSAKWYKTEARIIKTSVRTYAPDGLYWHVLDKKSRKKARYPYAVRTGAKMYHYGWVRPENQVKIKVNAVSKYWNNTKEIEFDYGNIDQKILKKFNGTHPEYIKDWIPENKEIFKANSDYKLTGKDKLHRITKIIEKLLKIDLSKKHIKLIK